MKYFLKRFQWLFRLDFTLERVACIYHSIKSCHFVQNREELMSYVQIDEFVLNHSLTLGLFFSTGNCFSSCISLTKSTNVVLSSASLVLIALWSEMAHWNFNTDICNGTNKIAYNLWENGRKPVEVKMSYSCWNFWLQLSLK